MNEDRRPKAFISCSLHEEDEYFALYIERILKQFGFEPYGTIGKHDAAPLPIPQAIRQNMKSADCLILVATPRYMQQDMLEKERTGNGLSEYLHFEAGMAFMAEIPILVFSKEGTNVGNIIPNIVQYIELQNPNEEDLMNKWPLIANYFRSAMSICQERWRRENRNDLLKFGGTILALIGGAAVVDALISGDDE